LYQSIAAFRFIYHFIDCFLLTAVFAIVCLRKRCNKSAPPNTAISRFLRLTSSSTAQFQASHLLTKPACSRLSAALVWTHSQRLFAALKPKPPTVDREYDDNDNRPHPS
jgi:hypothetical protein